MPSYMAELCLDLEMGGWVLPTYPELLHLPRGLSLDGLGDKASRGRYLPVLESQLGKISGEGLCSKQVVQAVTGNS
jgi:hypothetical protein